MLTSKTKTTKKTSVVKSTKKKTVKKSVKTVDPEVEKAKRIEDAHGQLLTIRHSIETIKRAWFRSIVTDLIVTAYNRDCSITIDATDYNKLETVSLIEFNCNRKTDKYSFEMHGSEPRSLAAITAIGVISNKAKHKKLKSTRVAAAAEDVNFICLALHDHKLFEWAVTTGNKSIEIKVSSKK